MRANRSRSRLRGAGTAERQVWCNGRGVCREAAPGAGYSLSSSGMDRPSGVVALRARWGWRGVPTDPAIAPLAGNNASRGGVPRWCRSATCAARKPCVGDIRGRRHPRTAAPRTPAWGASPLSGPASKRRQLRALAATCEMARGTTGLGRLQEGPSSLSGGSATTHSWTISCARTGVFSPRRRGETALRPPSGASTVDRPIPKIRSFLSSAARGAPTGRGSSDDARRTQRAEQGSDVTVGRSARETS